jgi:hypothetical protein
VKLGPSHSREQDINCNEDDKIKKDEVDEACRKHGRDQKYIQNFSREILSEEK